MIKLIAPLQRRDDMTSEQFSEHWLTKHAPLVVKLPGLRRYVQNVVFRGRSGYDGVSATWWDDEESLQTALESPLMAEIREDKQRFSVSDLRLTLRERPMLDLDVTGRETIKFVGLLKRREDFTPEQFTEHWIGMHGAMALELSGIRRYVQNAVIGGNSGYDGVAEMWWDDVASMKSAFEAPIGAELAVDEKRFLCEVIGMLVVERPILH